VTLAALWPALAGAGQLVASSNRPQAWRELAVGTTWQVAAGKVVSC
jgi:hypothetical protein